MYVNDILVFHQQMSVSIEGDADAAKAENEKEEALREGRAVRKAGRDGDEDEEEEEEGKGRREGGGGGEGKRGRRKKNKTDQETEKSGRILNEVFYRPLCIFGNIVAKHVIGPIVISLLGLSLKIHKVACVWKPGVLKITISSFVPR